ncbi:MAG TPA: universal stress protein [Candidatus Nanopelagicaceae bacterium]|nr:universal stress protein [Candidatus Nanopelagicaceae bacterium]
MAMDEVRDTKGHIIVGVDGSETSMIALRWAAKLAPTLGGNIVAVIAWDYPARPGWEGEIPDWWRPDEDAIKILDETLDSVFGKNRPVGLVTSVQQGRPTPILIEASKDADMLIIGSRGLGGFAGMLLGSVSSSCAEHAHCPVLVVHGDAE